MNLYVEKVFNYEKGNSKFTITHEIGDILDIAYFAKALGVSVEKLLNLLKKEKFNACVINDILVFTNKNEAKKARDFLHKQVIKI